LVNRFRTLDLLLAGFVIWASRGPSIAAAQPPASFQVSGRVDTLRLSEFDSVTAGAGVSAKWNVAAGLAVDGVISYFPERWQTTAKARFTRQSMLLILGGVTPGFTRGRMEFFGRAHAGVLDHLSQQDPFPCLAIFPVPLECQLAAGYTALAVDVGAGVDLGVAHDGRLRLHAGVDDLIVRYRLNALRPNGSVTNGFTSHNLLMTAGVGWRF